MHHALSRTAYGNSPEALVLRGFDWLFVLSGVLLLFFFESGMPVFVTAGILPVLWLLVRRQRPTLTTEQWLVLACLIQMPIVMAVVAALSPPPDDVDPVRGWAFPGYWLPLVYGLAFLLVRFIAMQGLRTVVRYGLPVALIFAFAFLSFEKFMPGFSNSTGAGGTTCRTTGFTPVPFWPALLFFAFTLLTFFDWKELGPKERQLRFLLVFLSVVVTSGYSMARMVSLLEVATLGMLALMFLVLPSMRSVRTAATVLALIVLGLLAAPVVGWLADCQMNGRLQELFAQVSDRVSDRGQTSISLRYEFWAFGWQAVMERPWTGYGIWAEAAGIMENIHPKHDILHNQYLSWWYWGGIPTLASGVVFLLAPVIAVLRSKTDLFRKAILLSCVLIPGPMTQVSDSFYINDVFIIMISFATVMALALAWSFETEKETLT